MSQKFLQYFGNMKYNLADLGAFADVICQLTTVGLPSWLDTLQMLIARFASLD